MDEKVKEAIERLRKEAPEFEDSLKSIILSCKMKEACLLSQQSLEEQIAYLLTWMDIDRLLIVV